MKKLLFDSLQKLDFVIWWLTLIFFVWSALLLWWNINESFMWASAIIVLMFLVWFSIELILAALKNVKWVWKITWFITNWPEALVLIVWLIWGNVLFAASTPLGSNVMNPILLFVAVFISWYLFKLKTFNHKMFFTISFILTAFFAIIFFKIPENYYIYWMIISFLFSIYLFTRKFHEDETIDELTINVSKIYLPLWLIILLISWYFLDPVVDFTAEASLAPKWVIWFLVLATLTSWPEFKSVLALLKRNKTLDAFENILVSNITNLWLAIIWVVIWMMMK
jgi:cation:H+ antiporter